MSDAAFGLLFLLAVFAPAIIFVLLPLAIIHFMYKKEFSEELNKHRIAEAEQAIPIHDLSEAKNKALSGNVKIMLWYGGYFVIEIPIIVSSFGAIQYGPNVPYLVFLVATGVPWLACFVQSLARAEKHRLQMTVSNIPNKPSSIFTAGGMMFVPMYLLIIIMLCLQISNRVLS